jgi:hypothetical protein
LIFLELKFNNSFSKSSAVVTQKVFIAIYQILLFKIFHSTEGISTFSLVTFFVIKSFSHFLKITNSTCVQAGHLIYSTAEAISKSTNSLLLALIIISQTFNQAFCAGAHFKTCSISTQSSTFFTTAQIH